MGVCIYKIYSGLGKLYLVVGERELRAYEKKKRDGLLPLVTLKKL